MKGVTIPTRRMCGPAQNRTEVLPVPTSGLSGNRHHFKPVCKTIHVMDSFGTNHFESLSGCTLHS